MIGCKASVGNYESNVLTGSQNTSLDYADQAKLAFLT